MINEARLDRVAQGHPEHQFPAAATDVVSNRQRNAEIVRRMAGFALGQEVVHDIDVAHERGVPERSVDRVRPSTADQHARAGATKLFNLLATSLNRAGPEGGDAAAQRIQYVNRQLLARLRREVVEFGASGVPGESFDLGHDENLLFWWTGWRL